MKSLQRVLTAGLMATAFAATVWAQTDVTTTRVSGTVSAEDGSVLPGVAVAATNQETGLVVSATTDGQGFYRLLNLPTGTYTFTAALEGFATSSRSDVRLLLGSTPSIDFAMQVSAIVETINVTSEIAVIEVTNTSNSTTVTTEQIEKMPLPSRDFRNLVLLTPQTRFDSERGNLAISGQRGINTNVTLDGVDFNNAFFGGTVGGAEGRAPLSVSQESIKEFSVITNGASVEFGRSGGGFVNVITKSGTNSLHGSVFYYDQPQSLISNFADGTEPADQTKDQYGGSIGGRIVTDKLFYFLSYDEQNRSQTVPIDGRVLDADVFARYPQLASPSTYASTQDGDVLFGRLDWQPTSSQRLMLRGNFTNYAGENGTSTATTRTASYNGVEGLDTEAWVASYSGQWGNNLLNDLNINYITEDTPRLDKGLDLPDFQVSGLGAYGEVSFLPIVSTTERKGIGDTVTWLTGDHVLKFGGEYNDTSINQVFKGNWRGVFRFNSKADFLAGKWASYNQFGGLGGLTADEAGKADFGQKETALFVQDQWFMKPNLTISAGLRFESQDNPDNAALNPLDRNANGSFNLTAKVPDQKITDQISPRLGITWSPGDQKSVLRFSAGRFWSRTPAILLAQLYTSNGLQGTQYQINAPRTPSGQVLQPTDPLAPGWGANFTVPGTERIDFTSVPNPRQPGVFAIDPNFENPYTDRLTLGFEREVAPQTVVGIDITYAEAKQLQRLTDINLQYAGTNGANGLPRYSSTRPNSYYGRITTSTSDARVAVHRHHPPRQAPDERRLPVLCRGHLVKGQRPRLERAQLRRYPGRGRQEPRPQLRPFEPRSGLARHRQRPVGNRLVGHQRRGEFPLLDGLAVDDHRRFGCQRRHQLRCRSPDHSRRSPGAQRRTPAGRLFARSANRQGHRRRPRRHRRLRRVLQLHQRGEPLRAEQQRGLGQCCRLHAVERQLRQGDRLRNAAHLPVRSALRLLTVLRFRSQ